MIITDQAYLAHPFVDRDFVKMWQESTQRELDQKNIGLKLWNPFVDRGQPIGNTRFFENKVEGRRIVENDMSDIQNSKMLIAIILTPEKCLGTYMEILLARIIFEIPVYVICPDINIRKHIWIEYMANEIFPRTQDFCEKILFK